MRGLSLIIIFLFTLFSQPTDSPHEKDLEFSCDECHTSEGWEIDRNNISFNHNLTEFKLLGLHQDVNCISCHESLVFNEAEPDCMSCHTDMHEETVGYDCARCHTSNSWIVENITEIHQESRFPLLGAHNTADCYDCHKSASLLRFDPLGVECIDCHQNDYQAATSPNHIESGYSTDCSECHQMNAFSWTGANFTHTFFPLTQGHAVNDCALCHTDPNDYSDISSDCVSCHLDEYNTTSNPNHQQVDISTDCIVCHTTDPDWKPAKYGEHDALFPIYSGEHNGEWETCTDCHTNPSNYSLFTCIDCHEHNKGDMDDEHSGIGGYAYNSIACLECHPNGTEDGFDHNASSFPLTGAHITTECSECHLEGYTGTTSICFDCHTAAFDQSTEPNHTEAGFPNDCMECHTTDPGWTPSTYDHDEFYLLTGAHLNTNCNDCHTEGFAGTTSVCFDCHTVAFNQTTDPDHVEVGFPVDCQECHTTNPGWTPSTYDHNEFYPLTGAHTTTDCVSCHEDGYTGTPNNCNDCHESDFNQSTNPNHIQVGFSTECQECHTTDPGWSPATFVNHNDYFVLAGAHATIASDCNACHEGNYENTPNTCIGCHQVDYDQTTDPPHASAQFSTDCTICHTEFAWEPSTFDHDGQYFPIYSGKHQGEWNTCIECHTVPSDYSLFSCIDCHEHNKPDMDDDHSEVNDYVYNSIACLDCHPTGDDDSSRSPIKMKFN